MRPGLHITMLGGFSLHYNGIPVQLKKKSTAKPVQLLLLLLYHREGGISRRMLLDALFGQETEIDAANTLNATVSQLRKLLRDTCLPPENYIHARFDRYYFESSFPIYSDITEVTRLRQQADLMQGSDRQSILYCLCDLFGGRFLPELDGEDWAEIARAHYQRIYRDSLSEIFRMLEERRSYSEILRLSQLASRLFPYDEWQVWQQESLLALGRFRDARQLYHQVQQLYWTQLDAPPPERMSNRLRLAESDPWNEPQSAAQVRQRLRHASGQLPTCIPFAEFLNALDRRDDRNALLLCTLTGTEVHPELFHQQLTLLEEDLVTLLSRADLLTRVSRSQFLLLQDDQSTIHDRVARLEELYASHSGHCRLTVEIIAPD